MYNMEPSRPPVVSPCPGVMDPRCNQECYHATDHEYDDGTCHFECPLVPGVICKPLPENRTIDAAQS